MFNTSTPTMTIPGHQPIAASRKRGNSLPGCTNNVPNRHVKGFRLARYLMDSWFGAVVGGGIYGGWAVWANWAQGTNMALAIGAAHWMTSALLTFFGTMAMRQFYGRAQGWTGVARAFVGGLGLTYASLFAVHGLLGTEQLLLTLAPGIIPNILFCSSYALLLKRTNTEVTP